MTDEEWESIWNGGRIYYPATGQFGTVQGWEQNSLVGRTYLKIQWDHLTISDLRECHRGIWKEKLEIAIDAMKLYEELRDDMQGSLDNPRANS